MALLEVRGLAKVFSLHGRTVNAIESLTLDVEEGEFVSIVGPSGCGKSTFLHIVGGFEHDERRPHRARRRADRQSRPRPRHAVPGPLAVSLADRDRERLLAARDEAAAEG